MDARGTDARTRTMELTDLSHWLRSDGLEIALIVEGALLGTRALRWLVERVAPTRAASPVAELPERLRYRQAVLQALHGAAVGLVWFVAVMLVLMRTNIPVATLVAPATVAGAAVGFGAQRVVADFLNGFFIVAERQYGVGDVVQISPTGATTGVVGTVVEVTLRYTRLRTPNHEVLILPNSEIRQVINRSRGVGRVDVDVPLVPTTDIDRVTEELQVAMHDLAGDEQWSHVLVGQPEVAGIEDLDVEAIRLRVTATTVPGANAPVAREVRRRAALVTGALQGSGDG
jgi:small conductance mechanosensitive channel